jgi:hypothetical protein
MVLRYAEGLGAQNQVCGGVLPPGAVGGEDTPSTGYALGLIGLCKYARQNPADIKRIVVVFFEDPRKVLIDKIENMFLHMWM